MKFSQKIGGLIDETEHYVDAKIESIQLETVEKTVNISAAVLSGVLIFGMVFLAFLTLSAVAVIALAQVMSYLWATILVFAFLPLASAALIVFKKRLLIQPIKNFLFGEYFKAKQTGNHE
jgi:Cu/Ag efflux pump CusA